MTDARCTCGVGACPGWMSLSPERWPRARMQALGTLRDPGLHEPTFEELHLNGTRYDSADAPVAVHFYPYNRCTLWHCVDCRRVLMRYTEGGGYYVDERVRDLVANVAVRDDPAP